MPIEKINTSFEMTCKYGNLELAKYLLFDKNIINADLEKCGRASIINACYGKHNEVVKFLLDGKDLTKHVSVNVNHGSLLTIAVDSHNIELLNYLLDKNNKKMSLNQNNDE